MQRGGKKSPFLGRTERMESASQLLYPRYRSLSDAFLYPDGAAVPVTPTQVNTVQANENVKKPKKKKRKVKEDPVVKSDSPAAAAPTGTPAATQTAAPAAVPAAAQAGVEEALPAPPAGPAPSEYVARRVFVGGMPFSYEVDAIREYWSFCGEIEDLDVMRFPDTGRFKGIAFITYATEEGYLEALKCDGTDLDGQQLRVQKCMSAGAHVPKKKQMAAAPDAVASPAQQQQSPAPKVAGYHVAYVGNLAFEATDAEIQQLFPDCNVTKVRLHTDKNTGKSRGFAHVHFLDEPSLDKALQFNGSPLHRRQVKVSYAQPKKGS
ncbi:hypothetical protein WJX82_000260 [Trebouxia sp. C0006]